MKSPDKKSGSEKISGNSVAVPQKQTGKENFHLQIPNITLPKGGGALKQIDETFQVNAANGTAAYSIPLPLSPNRNGFTPNLSLNYNSGTGNSLFGIGWELGLPMISRRTDKKIPRYLDSNNDRISDSEDSFMFSGTEELVPFLERKSGTWKLKQTADATDNCIVRTYRPRVEGGFSRIERIWNKDRGYYWKVTTADNITTFFGYSESCRITDPSAADHIYTWLPEFSYDNKGSWIWYSYKPEDLVAVVKNLHEKNRTSNLALFANKHLKSIRYGNTTAWYPDNAHPYTLTLPVNPAYHFELVLDYGEHDALKPKPTDNNPWKARSDAFSSCRAGFEIRSYRLCKRMLLFHTFPELNSGTTTLVNSLELNYTTSGMQPKEQPAEVTYLTKAWKSGYILKSDSSYSKKDLPAVTFNYQLLAWDTSIKEVNGESLINAPEGLNGTYRWVDFYNEGISGLLTEQAQGWYYKSNMGADEEGNVQLSPAIPVLSKPAYTGLTSGILQLLDLEANGQKQLLVSDGAVQGYFEQDENSQWQPFRAFLKSLRIDLHDPNIRFLDLNGDGCPEALMADQGAFLWWESLGKTGYDTPSLVTKSYDEEKGPAILFADPENCIFLADMTGDGLSDIVRIRNGEICYWANMGYGRFSAKVTMSNAPVFDLPEQFNPGYLHLADISGTGATDIIYLGKNKFSAYLNLSGNSWSDATSIDNFFPAESPNEIDVTDLLGQGTACIVWSSGLPGYRKAPMRYIDLMGGKKPHIMISQDNGFGKLTSLEYKSSTYWYLQDKKNGSPWLTKLAFPVQCVSKVVITETVTNLRLTSAYSYHHGYYDHDEREFRGFGRVEQLDTESFEMFEKSNAGNISTKELFQPPVLKKTWFHTGAYLNKDFILNGYKKEYWYENYIQQGFTGNPVEFELPDSKLTVAETLTDIDISLLTATEWREAMRACKGMELRQEIFALDATDPADNSQLQKQAIPYTVITHNCHIELLQQKNDNMYASFFVKESEAISYHYERVAEDPRIEHSFNLKMDEYGNVLESVSVVYPRLKTDTILEDQPADNLAVRQAKDKARKSQQKLWVLFDKNELTNDVTDTANYQLRKVWQTNTWEFTGIKPAAKVFTLKELMLAFDSLTEIPYQQQPDGNTPQKRKVEQIKSLFYDDALNAPMAEGKQAVHGISYEKYQLAFTPDLVDDIFTPSSSAATFEVTDADMQKAGFLNEDTNWWIRSGTIQLKTSGENISAVAGRFFTPVSYTDPFGSKTEVTHDSHYFFINKVKDPNGNETKVIQFSYRTLSATRLSDCNDNINAVISDELGRPKASSVEGKDLNNDNTGEEGDNLNGYTEISGTQEQADIAAFFAAANASGVCNSLQLQAAALKLLSQASTRLVYNHEIIPSVVATITRELHSKVNPNAPLQISFEYSDGMGQVVMKKSQAEPGIAKSAVQNPDGTCTISDTSTGTSLRWVATGRTVFNNKANPVKQYEPYFSISPAYEDAIGLVESGVTLVMYYDAMSRPVKTELPNGTFTKVVFDAWKEYHYDANDTVKDSSWYQSRVTLADNNPEKIAALKSAVHHGTPTCSILDTLGRNVAGIDHNKYSESDGSVKEEFYYTYSMMDVEGNTLSLTDARGNIVMQYRYDMLGNVIAQSCMDTGKRWMLNNISGDPVKSWDERKHEFSYEYDINHRLIGKRVKGGDGKLPLNHQYEKFIYGEGLTDDKKNNLRGKLAVSYDMGGRLVYNKYDFKGNLLSVTRTFAKDYKQTPDWNIASPTTLLDGAKYTFTTGSEFDALNRAVKQTTPDLKVTSFTFNPAGLLEKIDVKDGATTSNYISSIDYDAKGQRLEIVYGNNVRTKYTYDATTYRLMGMRSARNNGDLLQDLKYTYDPSGNIIQIEDKAIPAVFFNNQKTTGKTEYTYDSLYRLITATGREQQIHAPDFSNGDNWNDNLYMFSQHAGDPMAVRVYTQQYRFDAAGNIMLMQHDAGSSGSWKRDYLYETKSNRLKTTTAGGQTFSYPYHDRHGYMTAMPHLSLMNWNFLEDLQASSRQVRNDGGTPEITYYVYDNNGMRIRKVTENQADAGRVPVKKNERIYVGSYEIYKDEDELERESLHLMNDKQRIAMIDSETVPRKILGIPVGRTTPELTIRYQLDNHLGSVNLELDQTAAVITYEEYHPYGTTSYQAKNADIKAAAKRYRYTQAERDEETGLEYHLARYYISWLGRWCSADPSGLEDGLNVFMYVRGRPTIGKDLDGRALNLLAGAIGVGIGALVGGGIEAGIQIYRHGRVTDWGSVGASAVGGAVAGGMAGVTMGGSLLVQAAAAGVGSATGGAVTRGLTGQEQSVGTVATDAAIGVVTFGIVRGGGAAISAIRRSATQQVEQQIVRQAEQQVVTQATEQADQQAARQTTQRAQQQVVRQATQQSEQQSTRQTTQRAASQATRRAAPRPPAPAPAPRIMPRPPAPIGNIRFPDTNVLIRAARGGAAGRSARALLDSGRNYISQRSFREFMRGASRQQARYLQQLIDSGRVQVLRGNTLRALAEREGFTLVNDTVRQAGHSATDAQLVAITRAAQETAREAVYIGESRLSQVVNETYPRLGVNATRLP